MRMFTYLLQVQRASDGAWCHMVDSSTGLTLYLDVVSVSDRSDEELHGVALKVMKRLKGSDLKRRVLYFEGDLREVASRKESSDGKVAIVRRDQELTADHAYAIVEQGSDMITLGARDYTWALQEAVGIDLNPSGWRMARAGASGDSIQAGVVSLKPSFTNADWAEAGPLFLQHVLAESGAPERGVYRLMIWEGRIPTAELDPDRSLAAFRSGSSLTSTSTTTYHYRLQVQRRSGGWVNPVDRWTGAISAGCFGAFNGSEGELAAVAERVMERFGAGWSSRRVVFVLGEREQHEILRDDEVFGIVADGDGVFTPGPAHPGFVPGTGTSFGSQPRQRAREPWKEHGLADGQIIECGSCRSDITVRLVEPGVIVLSTVENMRGTAVICGSCGRLLCVDCVGRTVELTAEERETRLFRPRCDRCGEKVNHLQAADDQVASGGPATGPAR